MVDISDLSASIVSTGAVVFSGTSNTGSTVFQGTGSLTIKNESNPTDMIVMSLSGLIVTPIGTGIWDGIVESLKTTVFSGITLSENGYSLTGSVYKAGNDRVSLSFSGPSVMVQIYVGTGFNNQSLHVYRSDSGPIFDPIDACLVSLGICQFQTNHFSYFTFGNPIDSVPNTFAFAPQTSVELSANTDSSTVTLSGTNTQAVISISG